MPRLTVCVPRLSATLPVRVSTWNEAEVGRIAEQTAYLKLHVSSCPSSWRSPRRMPTSQAKHAYCVAPGRRRRAERRDERPSVRLRDESEVCSGDADLVHQADGQKVISQYLPEKTRVEIDNMIKEGVRIDAQGPSHQQDWPGHLVVLRPSRRMSIAPRMSTP